MALPALSPGACLADTLRRDLRFQALSPPRGTEKIYLLSQSPAMPLMRLEGQFGSWVSSLMTKGGGWGRVCLAGRPRGWAVALGSSQKRRFSPKAWPHSPLPPPTTTNDSSDVAREWSREQARRQRGKTEAASKQ